MSTTSSSCPVCFEPIYFYERGERYYEFTNFYEDGPPVTYKSLEWRTAEHAFQAAKFKPGSRPFAAILAATTPRDALTIGKQPHDLTTLTFNSWDEWDAKKDKVMKDIVKAKFEQNINLREMLLGTYPHPLIENSPIDSYWGCGADGKGKNMLGKILMEVREEIRRQAGTRMKYKRKYRDI